MHILYIDDDAEDREIFKEAITAIDPSYICNVANDGYQGLKALEEFVVMPDFIFVDVNMPRMTGRQFLLEIKKNSKASFDPPDHVFYHQSPGRDAILL